jgi:hypothetical protein
METSIFTRAGKLCRIILFAFLVYSSINAKILKEELNSLTIKSGEEYKTGQLVDFRGETVRNNRVALKWKVANPGNVSYTIEKSRDGEHFAAVQTTGIQVENENSFIWTDHYPKATNCYRLRMTDSNGVHTFSKTLVVETFKGGEVAMVAATPQVTLNDIKVDVQLREIAMINLHITNEKGETVIQQSERGKSGLNQYTIAGSRELKPGEYFLKVVVNGNDRMLVHLIKA